MHKALAVAAGLSLGLLGLWTTGTAAHADGEGSGQRIVVPAYFTDSSSWSAVDAGAPAAAMAIANVAGGPGDIVSPAWQALIGTAHRDGVRVLGYVDTGYFGQTGGLTRTGDGGVSAWVAQAEADVNEWYALYGSAIGGIYFDDALSTCGTDNEYANLYAQLTRYVKARHWAAVTIVSPGVDVPQCFANTADVIVRFENTYSAYQSFVPNSWESGYDNRKFMEIIHDTPSGSLPAAISESRANGAGYIYVTDQPYSSLPSYWNTEVSSVRPAFETGTSRPA